MTLVLKGAFFYMFFSLEFKANIRYSLREDVTTLLISWEDRLIQRWSLFWNSATILRILSFGIKRHVLWEQQKTWSVWKYSSFIFWNKIFSDFPRMEKPIQCYLKPFNPLVFKYFVDYFLSYLQISRDENLEID